MCACSLSLTPDLVHDGPVELRVGRRQVLQVLEHLDQLVGRRLVATLAADAADLVHAGLQLNTGETLFLAT